MECCWCVMGYKANSRVLKEFCSAENNTHELLQRMNSNLSGCLDCVMAYHYARQYFLKRNKSAENELFTWEVNRLGEYMRGCLQTDERGWQEGNKLSKHSLLDKLSVSLQEILNFPYLLWNEDLSNLTTEAILLLRDQNASLELNSKLPGVYLLIIHPNSQVREWAKQSIELLGSISCTDYDDLKDVIRWVMQLVEFDLLNCQSLENVNVLPQHLFMRNNAKEHWTSIFSLLTKFESRTIRLQLLSRDNHNQFITTILTAIDQENCQDYGRNSKFWPLLNCLLILLKRLESRIWQYMNIQDHTDFLLLVTLHPAFVNEIEILSGFKGKDVNMIDDSTAMSSEETDLVKKRLSDQQDSTSNESFQSQMCLWFKLFLRSIVPFGDEAKKAVKTVFKYFSCLKDEFDIPSEGYDCAMLAMITCVEFLLKNSLKSFLNITAKRWISDLIGILSLDMDESFPCQKRAISFCKAFLQNNQKICRDVDNLIKWLEKKNKKNPKYDSENISRLKDMLTKTFRDLPPATRRFSQVRHTITMPKSSSISKRSLKNKDLSQCSSKVNVNKMSTLSNKSQNKMSRVLLDCKVLLVKLDVEEKCVKKKERSIDIIGNDSDGDDDDEPINFRLLRKRSASAGNKTVECKKRKCVEEAQKLDTNLNKIGATDLSFLNDSKSIGGQPGSNSPDVICISSDVDSDDDLIITNVVSRDSSFHERFGKADWCNENTLACTEKSDDKSELTDLPHQETVSILKSDDDFWHEEALTKLIPLDKCEVGSLSHPETLESEISQENCDVYEYKVEDFFHANMPETLTMNSEPEEEDLQYQERTLVVKSLGLVQVELSVDSHRQETHVTLETRDNNAENNVQLEEIHETVPSKLPETLLYEKVSGKIQSTEEHVMQCEETLSTLKSQVSGDLQHSQPVELIGDEYKKDNIEFATKYEKSMGEIMSKDENAMQDLHCEETLSTLKPQVNDNLQDMQPIESIADEHNKGSIEFATKDKKSMVEILAKDFVGNVQHEETVFTKKSQLKENLENIEPVKSIEDKLMKPDMKLGTSVSSAGLAQSKRTQPQNPCKTGVIPSGRRVETAAKKSSFVSQVVRPVPDKNSEVKRKKETETKPSKPLTIEELFYEILRWDPNMLMKNFTLNVPNSGNVRLTYETMDDYYSVFKPLLFLECWAEALREWQTKEVKNHFTCVVKSIDDFVNPFLLVTCHQRIIRESHREENALKESDLIIVKTKDEKLKLTFAFVESIKQDRSCWKPGDMGSSDAQYFDLFITLRLIPKARALTIHEKISCVVVTSLVATLRRWKGLIFLPRSLLARDILEPRNNRCCNNEFPTGKADLKEAYNKSQAEAIERTAAALCLPYPMPRISFIQGPPGTGKSHTIIGLIKLHLKEREKQLKEQKANRLPGSRLIDDQQPGKVLLCAPSNAAVYVLVRRMVADMNSSREKYASEKGKNCGSINLVCVGRTSIFHSDVLPFTLDTLTKMEVSKRSSNRLKQEKIVQEKLENIRENIENLEKKCYHLQLAGFQCDSKEVKCLNAETDVLVKKKQQLESEYHYVCGKRKMLKYEEDKIRKDILLSADVICCTLSTSGSAVLHKWLDSNSPHVPFGCVIVDEACQSCELDLLIPLQFRSSKLVMVGDPEQLRSTVISKKAQELLLGQSMYERLYKVFKKRARSNGRALHMDPSNPVQLLDVQYRMHPHISLFPAKYIYQGRVKDERSLTTRKSICSVKPYVVLNVQNGNEQISPSGSLYNPSECDLVVEICQMLRGEISENNFSVITPYRAQVNLTQKRLGERGLKIVKVDTVDSFQGRETDVVIMSCVRANEGRHKSIGFLADRNRLNVALTRARHSLIILLNVNSLQGNSDWKACIDDARQRNVLYNVRSMKDLSQIFSKDAIVTNLPPTFNGLSSSHDVFSRKGDSPSRAFEKSDNPSTTELCTTHACVKSGNISTSDVPDLLVNVLNNKAGATGLLCGSWNPPNYTKSDAKMTSSDEFDFDDHEPDTYSCQK